MTALERADPDRLWASECKRLRWQRAARAAGRRLQRNARPRRVRPDQVASRDAAITPRRDTAWGD